MAVNSENAIVYTIMDKRKSKSGQIKTASLKFSPNNRENHIVITHKIGRIETDFILPIAEVMELAEWVLAQGIIMQFRRDACKLSCSPSDYAPGGKCEQNGCRQKDA